MGSQEKVLILVSKLDPALWKELRSEQLWRKRCDNYDSLKELLREKMKDDHIKRFLFQQRKGGDSVRCLNAIATDPMDTTDNASGRGKGRGRSTGRSKGHGKGVSGVAL